MSIWDTDGPGPMSPLVVDLTETRTHTFTTAFELLRDAAYRARGDEIRDRLGLPYRAGLVAGQGWPAKRQRGQDDQQARKV